jgi:tetratricopeptide (TPR) repeat protein
MSLAPIAAACLLLAGPDPFEGERRAPVEIVIERDLEAAKSARELKPVTTDGLERLSPAERQRHETTVRRLRMQSALKQARSSLRQKRFAEARTTLEPFVDLADASEAFLETLDLAYKGEHRELMAAGKTDSARLIADRMLALSGASSIAGESTAKTTQTTVAPSELKPVAAELKPIPEDLKPLASEVGRPDPEVVRANLPADKPADSEIIPVEVSTTNPVSAGPNRTDRLEARGKLDLDSRLSREPAPRPIAAIERAERSFRQRRYAEALLDYESAYAEEPNGVQPYRANWGYALLAVCYDRYNAAFDRGLEQTSLKELEQLERNVETARSLAPNLKGQADEALREIAEWKRQLETPNATRLMAASFADVAARRDPLPPKAPPSVAADPGAGRAAVPFRHEGSSPDGRWRICRTANFVIHHQNDRTAEEVAELAEKARDRAYRKWFPDTPAGEWTPPCELFLYPDRLQYGAETGVGEQSPGHCKVQHDSRGRIISRRLFIRLDDPSSKNAVLPHETVHVVLADRFQPFTSIPRWADEGMAVLTEPADKIQAHLDNLRMSSERRDYSVGRISARELIFANDYPAADKVRNFYAHSVGMCKYLLDLGGEEKLVRFVRLSLERNSYDDALREVYGMRSVGDLENGFEQFVSRLSSSGPIARRPLTGLRLTIDPNFPFSEATGSDR